MSEHTERLRQEALRLGTELIETTAPGLLSVTQVSQHVAGVLGIRVPSARRHLRANIPTGHLIELSPSPYWTVTWPDAQKAGLTELWLVRERHTLADGSEAMRLVLAADLRRGRPCYYGPGNTTYLTTARLAAAFVRRAKSSRRATASRQR